MTAAKFLTTRELADRWSMTEQTLRTWRARGTGPAWSKIGGRARYQLADVQRYEREARVTTMESA